MSKQLFTDKERQEFASQLASAVQNGVKGTCKQFGELLMEAIEPMLMRAVNGPAEKLNCSFCGKSQELVKKLVAGPEVCICDECVDLCNEILDEEFFEIKGTVPI